MVNEHIKALSRRLIESWGAKGAACAALHDAVTGEEEEAARTALSAADTLVAWYEDELARVMRQSTEGGTSE